jgi:trans-aconitate methyltransferase
MRLRQAIDLLAPGLEGLEEPATWADLGCGRGTFTRALAHLLPPGSTVHAMDRDASALDSLPASVGHVGIERWLGDFLVRPWPVEALDGILMANSLHYVRDQPALIQRCQAHTNATHRFLIVEYDTATPNPWVPYPVGRRALESLFAAAGYPTMTIVGSRRSIYQRAQLYVALIASP